MITYLTKYDQSILKMRGLSTDTKPVDITPNGSEFFEIDTGKTFLFDRDSMLWVEQQGSDAADAVKYTPQTLTDAQKAQARDNIGIGTDSGTSQQILDFALGMVVVDFGAADNIIVLLKDDDFEAAQDNFQFGADFGQNYAGIKTVTFIPITESMLLYGLSFPTTFLGEGSGITMKSAGAQPLSAYNVGDHHRTIIFTFDGMGNCYPDIIDRQM